MTDEAHTVITTAGRVSSEASVPSIVFMALFAAVGLLLALNVKGIADRFNDLMATVTFGVFDAYQTGVYRFIGAGLALFGCIGVAVEVTVGLS
ncbi:hypothetical protein GTW69_20635 [Streptomyces sp. SID7760]|nr:hypothetical protein [Streptomyces sp. SID7760]MYT22664.1 hypothetical protein [Streptomyces sp. SID7760]